MVVANAVLKGEKTGDGRSNSISGILIGLRESIIISYRTGQDLLRYNHILDIILDY